MRQNNAETAFIRCTTIPSLYECRQAIARHHMNSVEYLLPVDKANERDYRLDQRFAFVPPLRHFSAATASNLSTLSISEAVASVKLLHRPNTTSSADIRKIREQLKNASPLNDVIHEQCRRAYHRLQRISSSPGQRSQQSRASSACRSKIFVQPQPMATSASVEARQLAETILQKLNLNLSTSALTVSPLSVMQRDNHGGVETPAESGSSKTRAAPMLQEVAVQCDNELWQAADCFADADNLLLCVDRRTLLQDARLLCQRENQKQLVPALPKEQITALQSPEGFIHLGKLEETKKIWLWLVGDAAITEEQFCLQQTHGMLTK